MKRTDPKTAVMEKRDSTRLKARRVSAVFFCLSALPFSPAASAALSGPRSYPLDLAPYAKVHRVETLAGAETVRLDGTRLPIEIPERLGYVWVKLH